MTRAGMIGLALALFGCDATGQRESIEPSGPASSRLSPSQRSASIGASVAAPLASTSAPTTRCSPCDGMKWEKPTGELEKAVLAANGDVMGCTMKLQRGTTMSIEIALDAEGRVCRAEVLNGNKRDPEFAKCVRDKYAKRTYPKPPSGCIVVRDVVYFKPPPQRKHPKSRCAPGDPLCR